MPPLTGQGVLSFKKTKQFFGRSKKTHSTCNDPKSIFMTLRVKEIKPPTIGEYTQNFINTASLRVQKNGHPGLRASSVRNYEALFKTWKRFENTQNNTYSFEQLDKTTVSRFKHWLLDECSYSINHAGKLLSMLKTIGLDAQKNEYKTHPYINFIHRFSLPRQDKIIHTLSFKEMKNVEKTEVPKSLEKAKKWLILGFWLSQRVSDLLTLKPSQIRKAKNGGLYVDIKQQKTGTCVTVGVLHPTAIKILLHDFPQKMYPCAFNKKIKHILKLAGLTQMVKAQRYNGKIKRKEVGIYPKYAIIASHDLRRSFATNFYGKIPTAILMNMTGHAQETTFLRYIGLDQKRDSFADAFMQGMSQVEM